MFSVFAKNTDTKLSKCFTCLFINVSLISVNRSANNNGI